MKKSISIIFLVISILPNCFSQNKAIEDVQTKKPKNIILLIGDGMGTAQIYAGLTANKGWLNIERCPFIGFHKNQSSNEYVTDSGAGATAFATGQKTYNTAIGVDSMGKPRTTILEIASKNYLATGLVVTCNITDATPAAFIAHQPKRSMMEEIANDFLTTDVDVLIGGGRKYFSKRKDGKNLLDSFVKKGYKVLDTMSEVVKVKNGKLAGFIAEVDPPKISNGRGNQLVLSTNTALQILSNNQKGFFLMIEGSQIDWGGHANDADYVIKEMIDFDKAVGAALDFAEKDGNTLVIITADHETGGLALTNGDIKKGMVEMKFITTHHTGVMIPVFAYGPSAIKFAGIYQNTDIFFKIKNAFGF